MFESHPSTVRKFIFSVTLFTLLFTVKAYIDFLPIRMVTTSTALALCLVAYYIAQKDDKAEIASRTMLGGACIALIGASISNGGISSFAMSWFLFLPLISGFLIGIREAVVWMIIALVLTSIVMVAELIGLNLTSGVSAEAQWLQDRLHQYSQLLLISVVTYLYLRQIKRSRKQISQKIKELENEILAREKAEKETQQAIKDRERFFSNMSHELRTPLNSIIGFSTRLMRKSSNMPTSHNTAIEAINRSGKNLLVLINELLDLSFILLNNSDLDLTTFNLSHSVDHALKILAPFLEEQRIETHKHLNEQAIIKADAEKISQVIINCLSNSIRYTRDGTIDIRLQKQKNEGVEGYSLQISDTGKAIPQKAIESIFTEYNHMIPNTTIAVPSSGLGLPLAAKIVRFHGGEIAISSEKDAGNCLVLWLPKETPCSPSS